MNAVTLWFRFIPIKYALDRFRLMFYTTETRCCGIRDTERCWFCFDCTVRILLSVNQAELRVIQSQVDLVLDPDLSS